MLNLLNKKDETATFDLTLDRHYLTGHEIPFPADELIVSKTDPVGIMTYVNDIFIQMSGYAEEELLGRPHSLIRHPHMPRCVYQLLWETVKSGREIFAYVVNRCKNGDAYWVFAHVTPCYDDETGKLIGYHSNRRAPSRDAVNKIIPVYKQLRDIELSLGDVGSPPMEASRRALFDFLKQNKLSYDELIHTL